MISINNKRSERVLLAARHGGNGPDDHEALLELGLLVETAGGVVVGQVVQERTGIDSSTFLGSGKVAELAAQAKAQDIQLVVVDHELTIVCSPETTLNRTNASTVKGLDPKSKSELLGTTNASSVPSSKSDAVPNFF